MGDAFDVGLCFGTKHIDSVFSNNLTPSEQIDAFVNDFRSLKSQFVAVVTGNHERRASNLTTINPLKVMADRLNIPYYGASRVLRWNSKRVFVAHGASSGELTDFTKILNSHEGLDAVCLAHTHQLSNKRIRRFTVDSHGRTKEKHIELVRCGSFLKDAEYAKLVLHPPTPIGSAFLQLSNDGTLKARLGLP